MISARPDIHPDFQNLLDRYRTDQRFAGKEQDRQVCIWYLTELNSWVQRVVLPSEIQAVLLSGSFSSMKKTTPDLEPVVHGPWFRGVREGGSDIDVLFLYTSDIVGLLKLRWLDFNIPERELAHPDDFIVNTLKSLRILLHDNCSTELAERVEIHLAVLTPTLGELALQKYVRHMIQTGTLIRGSLQIADYGRYRNNPPAIRRPTSDPIIDRMSGSF